MPPWLIAQKWQQEHSTEDFSERVGWHLTNGYVWSTPDVFMLAHTVNWDSAAKEIRHNEPHNAWFVELAAASGRANTVRELLRVAPHALPWVCWRRDNGFTVKAYAWEKLIKKARI